MTREEKPEEGLAKKCDACEGKLPLIPVEILQDRISKMSGWELITDRETMGGKRPSTYLKREYDGFQNFVTAVDYLNGLKKIAESEGHHPDVMICEYKRVILHLWTHNPITQGVTEADMTLAQRAERLYVDSQK